MRREEADAWDIVLNFVALACVCCLCWCYQKANNAFFAELAPAMSALTNLTLHSLPLTASAAVKTVDHEVTAAISTATIAPSGPQPTATALVGLCPCAVRQHEVADGSDAGGRRDPTSPSFTRLKTSKQEDLP